jgi:hypothetical protein
MSTEGNLPVKMIAGRPVIPYQVDADAFEKLVSTAQASRPSSLKIERRDQSRGRRKEDLFHDR